MSETSTTSMDEAPHPPAQEAASTYEGTSDDRVPDSEEDDGSRGNTRSSTPLDDRAPGGTAALAESPVSSENAPVNGTEPGWDKGKGEEQPITMPDSSVPSETTSPSELLPTKGVPQPEMHPLPSMPLQDNLRLRMKVWTDPSTLKRYLMPMGFMRDLVNGQPVTDVMYAYAMHDTGTKFVELRALEWNALPFFYFQEDGYSPR